MSEGFKIWWDEENQIIREVPSGLQDAAAATDIIGKVFELLQDHPRAGILIDGKNTSFLSKNGGEMFREASLNPLVGRLAFLNPNETIEVDIAHLVNTFPDPEKLLSKFKVFTAEKEAIEWLKS